jgi:hypothetical protein
MSSDNTYIIDTSSLINLARWNPIDIYITVWKKLDDIVSDGRLISPEAVLEEISQGSDDLHRWAMSRKKMFKPLTSSQMKIVADILQVYPSLIDPDKEIEDADPYVIALALNRNPRPTLEEVSRERIVVSDESLKENKVNIPYVCSRYNLKCVNILEMFRIETWQF